jgi:hypothetical protein
LELITTKGPERQGQRQARAWRRGAGVVDVDYAIQLARMVV